MKKKLFVFTVVLVVIILILVLLPFIKIKSNGKINYISYTDQSFKYEDGKSCYSESYFYNEKMDISISDVDSRRILFFYFNTIQYKEGNVCDYEYYLEEEYITNFLNNAEIIYNDNNLDIGKLIEGRKAIVSNTLYLGNDYNNMINYKLDGKYQILYVFYVDDLLVIQVGNRDEGAKFIAYEKESDLVLEIQSNRLNCPTPLLKLYSDNTYEYHYTYNTDGNILIPKSGTYNYDISLILDSVDKYPELDTGPYVLTDESGVKYSVYDNNLELTDLLSEIGLNLDQCLEQVQ